MAKIGWDKRGEKRYEVGVDRGVFYHSSVAGGVPWNGLVSINETPVGGEITPHYIDGYLYHNEVSPTDFKAVLEAFTYPEEFDSVNGAQYSGGLAYLNQGVSESFGLSYRTLIGNDTTPSFLNYKISMIYNCIATPKKTNSRTIANQTDPTNFTWDLVATPNMEGQFYGHRPTSHIVWDSSKTRRYKTDEIERILYGTSNSNPRLPTLEELEAINTWEKHIRIIQNTVTGLNRTTYLGAADLTGHVDQGLYSLASSTRLQPSSRPGLYTLGV